MRRDQILERLERITKRIELGFDKKVSETYKGQNKNIENNIENLLEAVEARMEGFYKEES